jgi:uncharacterized protein Smg (DUF494 family)
MKVIFKKSSNGELTAFFPEKHSCYTVIGQHSEYVDEYFDQCYPTLPHEQTSLIHELEEIGYDLDIITEAIEVTKEQRKKLEDALMNPLNNIVMVSYGTDQYDQVAANVRRIVTVLEAAHLINKRLYK